MAGKRGECKNNLPIPKTIMQTAIKIYKKITSFLFWAVCGGYTGKCNLPQFNKGCLKRRKKLGETYIDFLAPVRSCRKITKKLIFRHFAAVKKRFCFP